jgi:hypothetical protein
MSVIVADELLHGGSEVDDLKLMLARRLGIADPEELPLVLDVPVAGKAFYDLSRPGSYRAAKDGSLITLIVAGRLKVPVLAQLKKVNGDAA